MNFFFLVTGFDSLQKGTKGRTGCSLLASETPMAVKKKKVCSKTTFQQQTRVREPVFIFIFLFHLKTENVRGEREHGVGMACTSSIHFFFLFWSLWGNVACMNPSEGQTKLRTERYMFRAFLFFFFLSVDIVTHWTSNVLYCTKKDNRKTIEET